MDTNEHIKLWKEFIDTKYLNELTTIINKGGQSINIDFSILSKFNPVLADKLLEEPEETITVVTIALTQFDILVPPKFTPRFFNIPKSCKVRVKDVRTNHLGKLICVEAVIRQSSDVRPVVLSARFECPSCGQILPVMFLGQSMGEPERCGCGRRGKFKLISEDKVDCQRLKVEDVMEELKGNEQGRQLNVFLRDNLTSVRMDQRNTPGAKIRITGVVVDMPVLLKTGAKSTTKEIFLQANHIEQLAEDYDDIVISADDLNKITQVSQSPNLSKDLVASYAPHIEGYDDIKLSIILQQFGAVKKTDKVTKRGDFHILLIGDPSTAKSVLIKEVCKISPKSRYTAGPGSSGRGLTASVEKDDFIGGWCVRAGAMVLANKGVLAVDEIDKMADEDRRLIHEALEQQCYDEQTELLTEHGWKFFKDLDKTEKVATLNPEGKLEYVLPTLYINKPYEGNMINIKSRRVNLLVTPNHNLFVSLYRCANNWVPFNLYRADTIINKRMKFKKDAIWFGKEQEYFNLPSIIKKNNQFTSYILDSKNINMEIWLEFLGYFLSEGHAKKRHTFISQTKSILKINKIKLCLDKLGFKYNYDGHNFTISNKQLSDYLYEFGKARFKYVPDYIKALSPRQIKIFLDAYVLGDGHIHKKTGQTSIVTSSKRMADDIQELLLKMGISGQIHIRHPYDYVCFKNGRRIISNGDIYTISYILNNTPQINHNKKIKTVNVEQYSGKIYCVEVPYHTLYIRRNGIPVWCGNTVSVDKASVHVTLKSETSMLAAGNPKYSRFDPYSPIADQIELEESLLSRFDLIFFIKDIPQTDKDEAIISKILDAHQEKESIAPLLDSMFMKKYIAHARKLRPTISESARNKIKEIYLKIRKSSVDGSVSITARKGEGIIRLSEAAAKMRLSTVVESQDVELAEKVFMASYVQMATDPSTGKLDVDRLESKVSSSGRDTLHQLLDLFKTNKHREVDITEVEEYAIQHGIPDHLFDKAFEHMKKVGDIMEVRPNHFRFID